MRKLLKSFLILSIVLGFLGVPMVSAYDLIKYNTIDTDDAQVNRLDLTGVEELGTEFKDANARYVLIRVFGTAVGYYRDSASGKYVQKEGVFYHQGSGTVVAPGNILTCAHVMVPKQIEIAESEIGSRVTESIKVTHMIVLIYDYKNTPIVGTLGYVNVETDIAIVNYDHKKNDWLKPIETPIEYRVEELHADTLVCAVLHLRDENGQMVSDVVLRYGKIVFPYPYNPRGPRGIAWLSPLDFTMDMMVEGGDSGSGLYVFRNGKPILIGVIRAMYMNQFIHFSYAGQLFGVQQYISSTTE